MPWLTLSLVHYRFGHYTEIRSIFVFQQPMTMDRLWIPKIIIW